MNRFSFSIRRVFHRLGQLGVMMTRSYGLTPSRFDLMHAIECQRTPWVSHGDVVALLGVRGPTVSRMVTALVQRGYLARRRDPLDARRRQIALTRAGRVAFRCAFHHIVKSGYMREVTARALSDNENFGRAEDAESARVVREMMTMLESLRRNCGDTSRFRHDDGGRRPRPIAQAVLRRAHVENRRPRAVSPLYAWIPHNLPLPRVAA